MKRFLKRASKAVKWVFIVFCIYAVSLFFRDEHIPGSWVSAAVQPWLPTTLVFRIGSVSYGFRHGVCLRGVTVHDLMRKDVLTPVIRAKSVGLNPLNRHLLVEELAFPRLPDSYYREGNADRNERLEAAFPQLGRFEVTLVRPDILSVRPERLTCAVEVAARRMDFSQIWIQWPDRDQEMSLKGFCYLDLDRQEVYGEVDGLAKQAHIRPLLVTLDVLSALPYMDAFTEVPEPCPSKCAWKVDLVRKDFDLWLELHPSRCRYNTVPMRKADGKIHVHSYTRNNCFNYVTTVGPIDAIDAQGRQLAGSVVITGTNGYNTVDVKAKSAEPIADVLKVGGFTGDYVGNEVIGKSDFNLQFRFPRSMAGNYKLLNGFGHIKIESGHLMRMKGFKGLIEAMPSVAPAVTWLSDSTQASCDYVIEDGVLKSDNIYIEGTCFSIKMAGTFDTVKESLDYAVRVQFAKKDSFAGMFLHPLAWPFTKLLLEFKLTGSPANPSWKYITVVDRVMEVIE